MMKSLVPTKSSKLGVLEDKDKKGVPFLSSYTVESQVDPLVEMVLL